MKRVAVAKFVVGLVIGILLVPTWLTIKTSAQDIPDVIINELAWAGSSASPQDEWIELFNPTTETVNISNWQITKDTSGNNTGETRIITIEENLGDPETCLSPHIIPAGGYFLIANNSEDYIFREGEEDEAESVLNIKPNCIKKSITLSNANLLIKLYDGQWDDGRESIDVAGNGGTPPAGDNALKISMERDTNLASWHDAVAAVNLDDGVSDLATPTAQNSELTFPPTITSIIPNEIEAGDILEIEEIAGTNFSIDPVPDIKLIRDSLVRTGIDVNVVSDSLIDYVKFDIAGAQTGEWDIQLTNPDDKMAILPSAITILEPPPEYDLTTTVRINEIYPQPNTTSNDEFIELYNFGDKSINLSGWQLDDIMNGGSSPYIFENKIIGAQSFLTIYKPSSKITLNDSGDSVHLIQPNDFVLDELIYDAAKRGLTQARFPEGWLWTETPTPNSINIFTETAPEPSSEPEPEPEPDDIPNTSEPDTESTPQFNSGDILICELLPNPSEGDEFIELYNPTDKGINLSQWQLKDASGKTHTINDFQLTIQSSNSSVIEPDQYIVIVQSVSNIYLNNSGGESLVLLDPSGNEIDFVTYPDKALKDVAYVLMDDGGWTWANPPTPGAPNIVILEEENEPIVAAPAPFELPPSGPYSRTWWGILLVSFSLTAIVFWRRINQQYYESSNYYHRLIQHL